MYFLEFLSPTGCQEARAPSKGSTTPRKPHSCKATRQGTADKAAATSQRHFLATGPLQRGSATVRCGQRAVMATQHPPTGRQTCTLQHPGRLQCSRQAVAHSSSTGCAPASCPPKRLPQHSEWGNRRGPLMLNSVRNDVCCFQIERRNGVGASEDEAGGGRRAKGKRHATCQVTGLQTSASQSRLTLRSIG